MNKLPSRAFYVLEEGDIITAVSGYKIGSPEHATAYVGKSLSGLTRVCSNGFRVLRNISINPFYLLYYLRTPYFLGQIKQVRRGSALPMVVEKDFRQILVYLPDKKKQNDIAKQYKYRWVTLHKARMEADEAMKKLEREFEDELAQV